jgi:hypothetical protein
MTYVIVEQNLRDLVRRQDRFAAAASKIGKQETAFDAKYVRRPTRGIEVRDKTPARIEVLTPSGKSPAPMYNSSIPEGMKASFSSNFMLQAVSRQQSEKVQMLTTFGAEYGYFFGQQPLNISFSALLMDTEDFPWVSEWWANYGERMRGTRLVEDNARLYLTYNDRTLEGYLLSSASTENNVQGEPVQVTGSMWVTRIIEHAPIGSTSFPKPLQVEGVLDVSQNGAFVSSSAAVRRANIEALKATAQVGWVRTVLNELKGQGYAAQYYARATQLLAGRNIVIPRGFAASDVYAGEATYASGSGAESLAALGVAVRVVPPTAYGTAKPRTTFYDNVDEYPFGVRTNSEVPNTPDVPGESRQMRDGRLIARAQAEWAKSGYVVTNETGWAVPSFIQTVVRQGFGAATAPLGGHLSGAEATAGRAQSTYQAVKQLGVTTPETAITQLRALGSS